MNDMLDGIVFVTTAILAITGILVIVERTVTLYQKWTKKSAARTNRINGYLGTIQPDGTWIRRQLPRSQDVLLQDLYPYNNLGISMENQYSYAALENYPTLDPAQPTPPEQNNMPSCTPEITQTDFTAL